MDTEELEHDAMVEEENKQREGEQYWGASEIKKNAQHPYSPNSGGDNSQTVLLATRRRLTNTGEQTEETEQPTQPGDFDTSDLSPDEALESMELPSTEQQQQQQQQPDAMLIYNYGRSDSGDIQQQQQQWREGSSGVKEPPPPQQHASTCSSSSSAKTNERAAEGITAEEQAVMQAASQQALKKYRNECGVKNQRESGKRLVDLLGRLTREQTLAVAAQANTEKWSQESRRCAIELEKHKARCPSCASFCCCC